MDNTVRHITRLSIAVIFIGYHFYLISHSLDPEKELLRKAPTLMICGALGLHGSFTDWIALTCGLDRWFISPDCENQTILGLARVLNALMWIAIATWTITKPDGRDVAWILCIIKIVMTYVFVSSVNCSL